jgi:hypothetical protein
MTWQGKRCSYCDKENIIGETNAIRQALHQSSLRGLPFRAYPCPHSRSGKRYHLTTQKARSEGR